MFLYMLRRLLLMILTLFGMSILVFVLLRLMPGNVADILFEGSGFVDPMERARIEAELGLDLPIVQQYLAWMGAFITGDFGFSYISERPALELILSRIPITAQLAAWALLFSVVFGVPLGVISAVRQNSASDYVLRVISLSGLSMPSFWLALLVMMLFLHLFGYVPIYSSAPQTRWGEIGFFLLPAAVVGFRSSALIMRLTRSSMLEVLRQDFIRTARSKGASERSVHYRHALRNAILPVVTIIGIEAAFLIGGLVVTETVFNIPGLARFMVEAIIWRDYPIVQNLVMLIALVTVLVNFAVDILYAVLDPRIKLSD